MRDGSDAEDLNGSRVEVLNSHCKEKYCLTSLRVTVGWICQGAHERKQEEKGETSAAAWLRTFGLLVFALDDSLNVGVYQRILGM